MIEYALFSQQPFELFVHYLEAQGLSPQTRQAEDCLLVCLPEDLEADILDRVDSEYDRLLTLDRELVDADESHATGFQSAGIVVTLQDGQTSYAAIRPDYLARILEVLAPEELSEVVEAIVDAVEHPDPRTACQVTHDIDDASSANFPKQPQLRAEQEKN